LSIVIKLGLGWIAENEVGGEKKVSLGVFEYGFD
jgi:hypothetical protein